jgi:hypothetical protein
MLARPRLIIIHDAESEYAWRRERRERRVRVVAWVAMLALGATFWAVVIGAIVK